MTAKLDGKPVIIGGGIAGLLTALHLAPLPVVLLSKSPLGAEASSAWAQGGLAASLAGDDTPALHLADTLAAGCGLCDAVTARHILGEAPAAISFLAGIGVAFDRNPSGGLRLGLEAAHSRKRIIHAEGGGSGREIMRALVAAVLATPSITVIEAIEARRLTTQDNAVTGVVTHTATGELFIGTSRIVLATGGIGGLFLDSTNPLGACGQGLAMAARAGACLADLEFIQFHPTALDVPSRPLPLISEAIRGEGAILVDETGRRFADSLDGAELAPRDVLTRTIWRHQLAGHRVFLDVRQQPGQNFAERFPRINSVCKAAGFDPAAAPIPVRPAQHYHMGGVAVDRAGRSSVNGLWACGEVACSGLHGANRLASNSLTEAAVSARWVAESVAATTACRTSRSRPRNLPQPNPLLLRPIISGALGIIRNGEALKAAISTLHARTLAEDESSDPAIVGLMLAVAALKREESRGAHYRTDFPRTAVTGNAGGGTNHRFGLGDAVLIKDNHIAMAGSIRNVMQHVRDNVGHLVKIEVEVDTLVQLEEALQYRPDAVLLDNMSTTDLHRAVKLVAGRATIEASGGVTLETAPAIAAAGVDVISVGWLTHSAPGLDIAMDFMEFERDSWLL